MTVFLSDEWFGELNESLRVAGPVPMDEGAATFRVVLEFPDAPPTGPHALTFTLSAQGASVDPGDHLAAEAVVRMRYLDAVALTTGKFDSATALREGRVKIRGDVNAIVPLLGWLQQAHPFASE